jgi:hypothetical protein
MEGEMKTRWIQILVMTLILSVSMTALAQKAKTGKGREKTLVGFISDSSCGLQHMAGMDDESCTLMCAKNGKFVLADRARKIVYDLDQNGQQRAREFAGKEVKIKGRLAGKTNRVTSIEAAS